MDIPNGGEGFAGAIILAGPTAGGKSALALALAERLGGSIINADSMQIYRELRVLSARPTKQTMARVPHCLYGVLTAAERCSVARWRVLAQAAIAEAWSGGRIPIITGGTGLYLKALEEGLAPIPEIPEPVRRRAREHREAVGAVRFHAELAKRDPAAAARLAPADSQRVLRAWEVVEATGCPLSDWQGRPGDGQHGGPWLRVLLMPEREELYRACDARLVRMMRRGALAEVRGLLALGLDPELPAMKALGVRELAALIGGCLSREDAVRAMQQATRRYAKRQGTWFRHQYAADMRLEQIDESSVDQVVQAARRFGLTLQR